VSKSPQASRTLSAVLGIEGNLQVRDDFAEVRMLGRIQPLLGNAQEDENFLV
jgi:hypothetical protein